MLTKIVNGKTVKLSAEKEVIVRDGWAQAEVEGAINKLNKAKEDQKEKLIRQKVEASLSAEFALIDAARTKADVQAVKLK